MRPAMKDLLRTLGAGLWLALFVKPPPSWRLRPAAHFWLLLIPTALVSLVGDFVQQTGAVVFSADGVQQDALGAMLVLAASAAVAAAAGQRVLTWSLAVLISATGLWISAFMLFALWAALQFDQFGPGGELLLFVFVPCLWWLFALLRLLHSLVPRWRWWQSGPTALLASALTVGPFFLIDSASYFYPNFDLENAQYADEAEFSPPRQAPGSAESLLYRQPAMVDYAVQQLLPSTPGQTDVYLLAFGGDGNEDVFRNEVNYAEQLMQQRFAMRGRTLTLLNHPDTTEETPLATLTNLRSALRGIAGKMNPEEDVLLLFLTTHGSADHQLFVDLQPLPLDQIDPSQLREALDASAIRWRVMIVSACYSGGFIDALQSPMSLVITAASADRASFGCGAEAQITYFGRALLAEALNETQSLIAAFELASEAVALREKADDFTASNPQIAIGALIQPKLRSWESKLEPAKPVPFAPAQ